MMRALGHGRARTRASATSISPGGASTKVQRRGSGRSWPPPAARRGRGARCAGFYRRRTRSPLLGVPARWPSKHGRAGADSPISRLFIWGGPHQASTPEQQADPQLPDGIEAGVAGDHGQDDPGQGEGPGRTEHAGVLEQHHRQVRALGLDDEAPQRNARATLVRHLVQGGAQREAIRGRRRRPG